MMSTSFIDAFYIFLTGTTCMRRTISVGIDPATFTNSGLRSKKSRIVIAQAGAVLLHIAVWCITLSPFETAGRDIIPNAMLECVSVDRQLHINIRTRVISSGGQRSISAR